MNCKVNADISDSKMISEGIGLGTGEGVDTTGDKPVLSSENHNQRSEFSHHDRSARFLQRFYPGIDRSEWNNYRWQLRKRLTSLADFERIMQLSPDEANALTSGDRRFSVGITPYYASLIDPDNPNDAIRKTMIPATDELVDSPGEMADPLGEDSHSPVPGIVHRYPDRVLFLITDFCPVYCRYCTRSRLVGGNAEFDINMDQWRNAIDYIRATPSIRDVLISGGDPLVYPDDKLEWLLSSLKQVKHVEIIRIGTKIPFVMPQRITMELTEIFKRYHPIYMSVHVTHPREVTPESSQACERLADAGIPLGSQTVLLKGVNDSVEVIRLLVHELLKIRVKPYYLLQCDPIKGSSHFRTPIQTGIDIISQLRGFTSGYAVPHYIVDLPGGGGKVSLVPEHLTSRNGNELIFTNYEGKPGFSYFEP